MNRSDRGFTLIEIMVSVSIMVILTIIGVVSYSKINMRSRDVKRKSDIEQVRSALEMYRSDYGYYPNIVANTWKEASGLSVLVPEYIPAIPSDPQAPDSNYYYVATNKDLQSLKFYGYCLCGKLETSSGTPTCTAIALPGECNYGLKNP